MMDINVVRKILAIPCTMAFVYNTYFNISEYLNSPIVSSYQYVEQSQQVPFPIMAICVPYRSQGNETNRIVNVSSDLNLDNWDPSDVIQKCKLGFYNLDNLTMEDVILSHWTG